jgi:hypothetical protein
MARAKVKKSRFFLDKIDKYQRVLNKIRGLLAVEVGRGC